MLHAPLVLADYAGTVDVSDVSEVRGRTTTQTGGQNRPLGFDVSTAPQLAAHVTDRQWEETLRASTSLFLLDLETLDDQGCPGCTSFQSRSTGNAGIAWHNRRARIALTEDASFGDYSSSNVLQPTTQPEVQPGQAQPPPSTTPALQLAPAPQIIRIGSSRTATAVSLQLDRRSSFTLGASYLVSGGLDASSRAILPLEYGAMGDGSLSFALSRSDRASTIAHVERVNFSPTPCFATLGECAPEDELAQASEMITHVIDTASSVSVTGGVAVARTRQEASDPFRVAPYPSADATLLHRFGKSAGGAVVLDAGLVPGIDIRWGIVRNRLQGVASLVDRLDETVTIQTSASAAQTIPIDGPLAAGIVSWTADIGLRVSRGVLFDIGERGAWQEQVGASFFSTFTFVDMTLLAPTLTFKPPRVQGRW